MFENLIGQERLVARLKFEIERGFLPSAILFSGDEYCGKLSAAFELSRVLICKKRGVWGCGCLSCRDHWLLSSSGTLFLGKRNFLPEIEAALQFGLRFKDEKESRFARIMIIRSINKLVSRFNDIFSDNLDNHFKKVLPLLDSLQGFLTPLYVNEYLSSDVCTEKWKESVFSCAKKIQDLLPDSISINDIRKINQWAFTSGHDPRTVIIDGVDSLNASAANALLKTLEEPPAGLTFILIAQRRGGVIPTILSRVRVYHFGERGVLPQQEVIRRVFRETDFLLYPSIQDYLYHIVGIKVSDYTQLVNSLVLQLCGLNTILENGYEPIFEKIENSMNFKLFLQQLVSVIQISGQSDSVLQDPLPFSVMEGWNNLIRETFAMNITYNQSIRSLLESLFYRMKNILDGKTIVLETL